MNTLMNRHFVAPLFFTFVILHSSFAVADDWPQYQCDPQRTGRSPEQFRAAPDTEIRVLWSRNFWPERLYNGVQTIAANGRVYIGTRDGTMWCFDAALGDEIWKHPSAGPVLNAAAVIDGIVVFPNLDGHLYALDAETGERRWAFPGRGGFTAAPLVAGGKIFIAGRAGILYCINPADGAEIWSADAGAPVLQSAAYGDGRIYAAGEDCFMRAYDAATGEPAWKSGPYPSQSYSHFSPVFHNGRVIFRAVLTQRLPPGPASENLYPFGSPWSEGGKRAHSEFKQWVRIFSERAEPPPEFYNAQKAILDRFEAEPGGRDLFVLNAQTGQEDYIVPHFPGLNKICGHMPPPAIDRDGLLIVPVDFLGACHGRLDIEKRLIVDVLPHGLTPMRQGNYYQGNGDEPRYPSTVGDYILLMHQMGDGHCAWQGVHDLETREACAVPSEKNAPKTYLLEKIGAPAAFSNGRFYTVASNHLVCRTWLPRQGEHRRCHDLLLETLLNTEQK